MVKRREHSLQFKITLKGLRPPIWRRILVPSSYSFWDLHVAIQDAMGWLDSHLHLFRIRSPTDGKRAEIGIPLDDPFSDLPEPLAGWAVPVASYFTLSNRKATYLYGPGLRCRQGFGRRSHPCGAGLYRDRKDASSTLRLSAPKGRPSSGWSAASG